MCWSNPILHLKGNTASRQPQLLFFSICCSDAGMPEYAYQKANGKLMSHWEGVSGNKVWHYLKVNDAGCGGTSVLFPITQISFCCCFSTETNWPENHLLVHPNDLCKWMAASFKLGIHGDQVIQAESTMAENGGLSDFLSINDICLLSSSVPY